MRRTRSRLPSLSLVWILALALGAGLPSAGLPSAGLSSAAEAAPDESGSTTSAVPSARARLVSGAGICLGAAGFSGSNYFVAFYQDRSLAKLGPYGGMSLIGGWLALTVL